MIIKRKWFSTPLEIRKAKEQQKQNKGDSLKDANIMTKAGTVGLTTAGALSLAAGVEGARSLSKAPSLMKEVNELKSLKDNKAFRSEIKTRLKANPYLNVSGAADEIIDKVRWAEKHPPKFSKLDKLNKGWNFLNKGSKLSRTVLGNAETYARLGVEGLQNKYKGKLSQQEIELMNKAPKSVGKASKMLLHWKNARALGRGAKWAAGIGGLLYLNGRALQTGSGMPTTSTSLTSKKGNTGANLTTAQ